MQISKNALVRLMALYGQALCTAIPLEKGNTPFHGEVMLFKSRDCKDPVILGIGLTEHTLAVTEDECYGDTILLGLGTGSFQSFKFGNISPDIDPTAKKQPKKFGGYAYSNNCGNSRGSVKVTNHNGLSACTNVYSKDKVARSFMFYRL